MAAVVASQHANLWPRRTDEAMHMSNINMSSLVPPYDSASRNVSNPPPARQYQPPTSHMEMNMPMFSTQAMTTSVPYQSGAYAFDSMPVNPYNMQQTYSVGYPPNMPHPVSYPPSSDMQQHLPTVREARNAFPMDRNPPVKAESSSPMATHPMSHDGSYHGDYKRSHSEPTADSNTATFSTDVDTLMKAIQAQQPSPRPDAPKEEDNKPTQKPKKRYQCSMPGCKKSFYQKTHLEIHTRAHTGVKPFLCKEPSCGQRFSQLGNLKTHERRHTGERPYSCDICGKSFAQRGNVRAHKIVHQQIKPFTCRLDDCGKQFTQLGNLKSHQNKFHAQTLRMLTHKFATFNPGDFVTQDDKDLFEYFASLYKNSNKGIKGRGKDRRISATPSSAMSAPAPYGSAPVMNRSFEASYHHGSSERSSRSSSLSSDSTHRADSAYEFNTSIPTGYPTQHQPYDDMVFPERKLY